MRLTRISYEGIGPEPRNLTIGARQLLTGANDTGKTSTIRAILIGLFGYDPTLGVEGTARLARGGSVSIELDFEKDDGTTFGIRRTVDCSSVKPKSNVRFIPHRGESTVTAVQARILSEVGASASVLNLGEFLGLSAHKRTEFLAALAGSVGGELTVESFLFQISTPEAPLDPATVDKIRRAWKPSAPTKDNVDAATEILTEALKASTTKQEQSEATRDRLRTNRDLVDNTPGTAAALTAEREQLRAEHTRLSGELRADEERESTWKRAQDRNRVAQERLAIARTKEAEAKAALYKINAELADKTYPSAVEPAPPPRIEIDEATRVAIEEAEGIAKAHRTEAEAIRIPPELSAEVEARQAAQDRDRLDRSRQDPWRKVEGHVAEIFRHLGPSDEELRDDQPEVASNLDALRHLAKEQGGDIAAQEAQVRASEAALEARTRECAARDQERERLRGRSLWLLDLAKKAEGATAKLREKASVALITANAEATTKWRRECDDARRINRESFAAKDWDNNRLTGARIAHERAESELRAAETEAGAAHTAENECPSTVDRETVGKQVAALAAQIKGLDERIAKKEQARSLSVELTTAEADADAQRERAKVLRRAKEQAKTLSGRLVGDHVRPVAETASTLLQRVIPGAVLELRTESGTELWARTGEDRPAIPFDALGGGFKLVFSAALTLALVRLQKPNCKMLLIDGAELDPGNLHSLLGAIADMAPDFGTVLVATCHGPTKLPSEGMGSGEIPNGWYWAHLTKGSVCVIPHDAPVEMPF